MIINIWIGGDVLGLAMEMVYYKCTICGSFFPSALDADRCCKRSKALIFCETLKENSGTSLEIGCNNIKMKLLGKQSKTGGSRGC